MVILIKYDNPTAAAADDDNTWQCGANHSLIVIKCTVNCVLSLQWRHMRVIASQITDNSNACPKTYSYSQQNNINAP